jgi:hypothetical protein
VPPILGEPIAISPEKEATGGALTAGAVATDGPGDIVSALIFILLCVSILHSAYFLCLILIAHYPDN